MNKNTNAHGRITMLEARLKNAGPLSKEAIQAQLDELRGTKTTAEKKVAPAASKAPEKKEEVKKTETKKPVAKKPEAKKPEAKKAAEPDKADGADLI